MTNKVKFKLKITGFELEMEGTKESTALITSQVSQTLRGLISAPSLDEEPNNENGKNNRVENAEAALVPTSTHSKRKRRQRPGNLSAQAESDVIDFIHEIDKYGMPSIKWSTSTKSLWLLYVVKQIAKKDAMTTKQIIETFNKHFKQAKTVANVGRDLGQLKLDTNYYVGEDTTKNPHEWYITESGEKHVQKLIADLKTQANGAN